MYANKWCGGTALRDDFGPECRLDHALHDLLLFTITSRVIFLSKHVDLYLTPTSVKVIGRQACDGLDVGGIQTKYLFDSSQEPKVEQPRGSGRRTGRGRWESG